MKYARLLWVFTLLLFLNTGARAQDVIYRVNPVQVIEGTIVEIGETSVRYVRTDARDDVTFNIPIRYIRKIVFNDGKELVYNDVVDVSNDRRNAIKLSFLSVTYDATTLFYERGLKPGQSLEFGVGMIGLGLAEVHDHAKGIILKAGYKFMSRPEFYQDKFRYAHLLKGSYIKPEITYVNYRYDGDSYYAHCEDTWNCDAPSFTDRERVSLLNFGVVGGKQWVFNNCLLLDLFGGIGFAVGANREDVGWNYNFVGGGPSFPITFTGGFKVGFLF